MNPKTTEKLNNIFGKTSQSSSTGKPPLESIFNSKTEQQGLGQSISQDLAQRKQNISDIQQQRVSGESSLGEIAGMVSPQAGEKVKNFLANHPTLAKIAQTITPDIATTGQLAGGVQDVIGELISAVTPEKIKEWGAEKTQQVLKTALGQAGLKTAEDYANFAEKNPLLAKNIEGIANIGLTAGDIIGAGEAAQGLKTAGKGALETAGEVLGKSKQVAKDAVSKIAPTSENIMNRVARLKPSDATKFEKIAGESHGKYLERTGNFGTPDEIVSKEAQKFAQSVNEVDTAMEKLPGKYQTPELTDVLNTLVEKEKSVKSPDLDRVIELQNKEKAGGLDMKDINEVKRLFERKVKLGYSKLINPEKVELATNMDNALRKWQFKKADELGFENLGELNKQTQMSKFIIDKLGDQIVGKSGLNGMSLTDWIMLSGGDPTSIGGLITKKFFSDPGIQAKIAKMLTKEIPERFKKARVGETKFKRLEAPKGSTIPKVESGSTIPVAPKGSSMEFTGQQGGIVPKKNTLPQTSIEMIKKDDGTYFKIKSEQANGELNAVLRNGKLKIINVSIEHKNQGKGFGKSLYKKLIEKADELGVPLVSDSTVSKKASNVYESLIKEGFNFKKNPRTEQLADGELFVADGRKVTTPVYVYLPEK